MQGSFPFTTVDMRSQSFGYYGNFNNKESSANFTANI